MQANNLQALSQRRLEQAEQCLSSAKLLLSSGDWKGSANRSYYSMFHAIRAVLALEGKDFAKHSGVINYFRMNYLKTNLINVELSDYIGDAFQVRTDCDYNDFYVVSKEEVTEQVEHAEVFLSYIMKFLDTSK